MIKVLTIFGTRPEAIKLAPVIRALDQYPDRISSRVCVTAQHRQMLDQVLHCFDLRPDYDLDVMQQAQSPTQVLAQCLARLEPILKEEAPDWILVQGDTTTVLAASIAAFYARVRVGHVEAGLRTFDKWQPFPEEINRRLTGVVADLHFAPTALAKANLLREGVPEENVFVTGNTVIDAVQWVARRPGSGRLPGLKNGKKLILVTAHRRENFGQPLEQICQALRAVAERYRDEVQLVYPVHLNPNVQEPVYRLLCGLPNVSLIAPLDYQPLIQLMQQAALVVTDSGGIQEEAPCLGVPVLVLREVTERPEAVAAGAARLVGHQPQAIVAAISELLENPAAYARMAKAENPFGDGQAARRIARILLGEPVEPWRGGVPAPAGARPLKPALRRKA